MDNPVCEHDDGGDGRQCNTTAYNSDPPALNGDTVNVTAGSDVVVRKYSYVVLLKNY